MQGCLGSKKVKLQSNAFTMCISLNCGTPVFGSKSSATLYIQVDKAVTIARTGGSGVCFTWYCRAKAQQVVHSLTGGVATTYPQLIPFINIYSVPDGSIECLIVVKVTPLTKSSVLLRANLLYFFMYCKTCNVIAQVQCL